MTDRLVMRLGLWSSVIVAVLGAVYLGLLIGTFSTEGFVFPPTTFVQLIGGIITFLTAPALLVLFAAIKHSAPTGRTILGTLGLAFTGLFAVCVSINRFVQLTVIRLSPPDAGVHVGSIFPARGLGRPGGSFSGPSKGGLPGLAAFGPARRKQGAQREDTTP